MRVSPQDICNFTQRAHLSLRRPNVAPTKTLLRRVAHRQTIRRTSHRAVSIGNGPIHKFAEFQPLIEDKASLKGQGRCSLPIEVEAEKLAPLPDARQKDGRLSLPTSCPGCGALTQEAHKSEAGFYSRSRKAVRTYLRQGKSQTVEDAQKLEESNKAPETQLDDASALERKRGPEPAQPSHATEPGRDSSPITSIAPLPVCDRCHDMTYNSRGVPIAHPSMKS